MRQKKGKLAGLRVAIIGDILHSRVVRSNIFLLRKLGASLVVSGPPTLLPPGLDRLGVEVEMRMENALEGSDVVMMLRVQKERMVHGAFPSLREYFNLYGLTEERVRLAKQDVIIMHPGPINRGVEIAHEVADGPYSVILEQVTNGVAVRMAVLYLLSGGAIGELAA
jgi:aspartate carbamoyltransferase catalytic subunit